MQVPDQLADIRSGIPAAILDIRYATTNNFTGIQLYRQSAAWLRPEPLAQLSKAAKFFDKHGYQIVIFDAYRSPIVQEKLKSVCDDTDYVADVSNHCRGITVDLTLALSGKYLDMGTEYDDFSPRAHANYTGLTPEQLANRQLLTEVMMQLGFVQHPNEWWHFDYQPVRQWAVIEDNTNVQPSINLLKSSS